MATNKMMTILIPAYNEQDTIAETVKDISAVLDTHGIGHSFVIVDDGSKDMTWPIISTLVQDNSCISAVKLSRNFGKEGAIFAGLKHADGDCCVVMDSDGQHPPALLPEMYQKWQEGAQIVEAVKKSRGRESWLRRLFCTAVLQDTDRCDGYRYEQRIRL